MKLKKFAALALAGVMAVSMLAGCSGKSTNTNPSNPGTDDDEPEVVPSSAIVTLFNNGQSAGNDAKVVFADDADLEADFKQAVEMAGYDRTDWGAEVANCYKSLTGTPAAEVKTAGATGIENVTTNFYTENTNADDVSNGDSKTVVIISKLAGSKTVLGVDAAARSFASNVDELIGTFDTTTLDKENDNPGDPYLNYTYEGSACVVTTVAEDNTPVYYAIITITQNVEKTKLSNPA